jgi:hypothetical protein
MELDCPAVSVIAEVKQRSQRPVIGWMTKIYYLELLRASEATLSQSQLHFAVVNTHSTYFRFQIIFRFMSLFLQMSDIIITR